MKKFWKIVAVSTTILFFSATAMPALPGNHWTVEAAGTVKLNKVPYQTTANLNLRTGPGTKYKVILTIPKGKQVTATEKSGNWYKVSYSYTSKGKKYTKTGWVSGSYLKKASSSGSSASASGTTKITKTVYQTTANLNMRTGPGTKYKVILTIPKGKQVTATEKSGSWYKVSYSYTSKGKKYTKTGWISGSYLKKVPTSGSSGSASGTTKITKTVYQTTANLNMRTGPGTKYKVIFTIPNGKTVSATEKSGSWLKVSYTYTSKGKSYTKTGWVSSSYLKEYNQYINTAGTYYFTTKTANLYSGPNTKSKAASVPKDNGFYSTKKVINSIGQTFYQVSHNGKTLYIYSGDVKKVNPSNFSTTFYSAQNDTYLYQNPGYQTQKLVKISKGTVISSNQSVGSWYKAAFDGKTGFVPTKDFSKYNLKFTETKISGEAYFVNSTTYLYPFPDKRNQSLTTVPGDRIVWPTHKTSNGWFKISYSGKTGYVEGKYLLQTPENAIPYLTLDLRKPANITAQDIRNFFDRKGHSGSQLKQFAQDFVDAGKKYGINASYLVAHAIWETGWGGSNLTSYKNNLYGYGAYDLCPFTCGYYFPNVKEGINFVAYQVKNNYLMANGPNFNGYHLIGMNKKYATDPKWKIGIASLMADMKPYDASYYNNQKPVAANGPKPPNYGRDIPEGKPVPADIVLTYPKPVKAKINGNVNFRSLPYLANWTLIESITNGTEVTVVGYNTDVAFDPDRKDAYAYRWYRVIYNGKKGWVNGEYLQFIEPKSVKVQVNIKEGTLIIRNGPGTGHRKIGSLKKDEIVKAVVDN
ncbi:MAG: peptide-binding protein, partial [Bacillaceae bacterium]|nr:peptide-binding protein [Bacillaceae bacterium]